MSTPLILRSRFSVDREVSPTAFSVAKFCSSSVALFARLPLETVLRRGQMAVLSSPQYAEAVDYDHAMPTVVPPGPYRGVFRTMYAIVAEEGSRTGSAKAPPRKSRKKGKHPAAEPGSRRGQGLQGLWRGWKVSWWGLVGLWTASLVGAGGEGEF